MTYFRYAVGFNTLSEENRQLLSEIPLLSNMGNFIGTKEEITDTIRYYIEERGFDFELPLERAFMPLEKILIHCYFPCMTQKHDLTIHPLPDVELIVNANRFHNIHEQALFYRTKRRGGLYKFVPDRSTLFYLPEKVMEAMAEYDWKQHEEQVAIWNDELDRAFQQIEKHPNNELSRKVRECGADGVIKVNGGYQIVKEKKTLH